MEQYISKSALVAEIEKRRNDYINSLMTEQVHTLSDILDFIDTLEVKEIGVDLGDPKGDKSAEYIIDTKTFKVKEVDLEKEYKNFVEEDPVYNKLVNGIVGKAIAKHFFELGMAVSNKQKEE